MKKAISYLLVDFPEIGPLVGIRKRRIQGIEIANEVPLVKILQPEFEKIEKSLGEKEESRLQTFKI